MARSVIEGGSSKAAAARAFHATPPSPSFLDADRLQQVDDGRLALRASGVKRGKFVRLWLLPKAVQLRQAAQTLRGLTPYGFICKAGIQTHTNSKSPLQQNAGTKQPNPPF